MVLSTDKDGNVLYDEITINVSSPFEILDFDIYPDSLILLQEGSSRQLHVEAEYKDSISREITFIDSTSYKSSDTAIVIVDNKGKIHAKTQGDAIINIENNGIIKQVRIIVINSIVTHAYLEISNSNGAYLQSQNYPNPFSNSTIIEYSVKEACKVQLDVYNINGQLINTMVNQTQPAGKYSESFDAAGLNPGIYIYKIRVGSQIESHKMILIKQLL